MTVIHASHGSPVLPVGLIPSEVSGVLPGISFDAAF